MNGYLGIAGFLLVLAHSGFAQGPQVTIPDQGVLEGASGRSWINDRPYFEFQGIPFASPPTGARRFQPPAPPQAWSGVFNATRRGQICPQTGIGAKSKFWDFQNAESEEYDVQATEGPEDCLFLHVFTPQTDVANLPVVVFFHGGAFLTGSSWIYDGFKFMDHHVVLVVPHYRLGPLGFLNLANNEIAGNAGMLDQVEALKWVNKNIGLFGGDKNKVTVMGESAGGASSSMLAISPLSTGLFQQYISQSGTAAAQWALDREYLRAANDIGQLIGCTDFSNAGLTSCFMAVDAMELVVAFDTFVENEQKAGRSGFAGSSPTIQTAGTVRFLEREPLEILEEGSYQHKKALLGSNKNEGTLLYERLYSGYLTPNNLLNDETYLKRGFTNFMLEFFGAKDQGESIAVGIEKGFFGLETMGNLTDMAPGIIDFGGAMFLKGPGYDQALYNSKFADTYLYTFDYVGDDTLWLFFGDPAVTPGGVCHANELILLFKIPGFTLSDRDKAMGNKIVQIWTNFIIYGEPNPAASPVEGVPTWSTFTSTQDNYMRLNEVFEQRQGFTATEYFIGKAENFPW